MNISRTVTATFSYAEIVEALKAHYPTHLHIQVLPSRGYEAVEVEKTAGKGLQIKYTTNLPATGE